MIDAELMFRINFSHADYEGVKEKINIIRASMKNLVTTAAILGDLQGPKLRVGMMNEGVVVMMVI
jgi:pyruvate kinase